MDLIMILGAALLLHIAFRVTKTIVRAHASPLSKLPSAGRGAAYLRLFWAFPQEFRGTITLELPKLHRKFGPLLRIGPNEVSFYSLDVYDAVHKVNSGFQKDPRTYGQFVQGGHPALFSITDPGEHSKRRRIMGQLFQRSKMANLESLMIRHVESFVETIRQSSDAFDIGVACRALEADIISDFSFGTSLGAVGSWGRGDISAVVTKNDEKATWIPLLTSYPMIYQAWHLISSHLVRVQRSRVSYHQGLLDFDQWTNEAWDKALRPENKLPYPNLIRTLVGAGLPPQTALSEAKENLGPGTDTTSGSLAHILFALAHNELYQQKLHQDLHEIGFSTDMTVLENIPRLKACIKEGIRWAGTAAAMLPRIVPEGGVELHGTVIPEGTVLTSSPIWYLRDEEAFPNPEEFDPYRWIDESGTAFRDDALRDRYYMPFSKGTNTCIGSHFAYYELYLGVSQLVKSHRFQVVACSPNGKSCESKTETDWRPVNLPRRREWVAAVVTEQLLVKAVARGP